MAVELAIATIAKQRKKNDRKNRLKAIDKEVRLPLEQKAHEIIEINLTGKKLSKKDKAFVKNIIADCLLESPESEKTERFF